MDKAEVLKLAKLARIDVSPEEIDSLTQEIDSILSYIGEIKSADVSEEELSSSDVSLRNIFRPDSEPHPPGKYTEDLLKEAPFKKGDYIKVKKIL